MKALLLHCKHFRMKVGILANRPSNVQPEPVKKPEQNGLECVVAMITAEEGDTLEVIDLVASDISKMAEDVGRKNIIILPFAHLSNKLLASKEAIDLMEQLKQKLSDRYKVERSHFGSHKEFLLDVHGHPGNVRYREY